MFYSMLFLGIIGIVITVYFIIGGLMAIDEPDPIDWIFQWPIMLWIKMVRKNRTGD